MIQGPAPTHQAVKPGTEGGVETLNIRTVKRLLRLRQGLALFWGSLYQAGFDFHQALGAMALVDLTDYYPRPAEQTGTTALAGDNPRAKRPLPRLNIAGQ